MASVQQILQDDLQFSELSVPQSFTLDDILKEPPNQYSDQDQIIDDLDQYFEPQPQNQQIQPYSMSKHFPLESQNHSQSFDYTPIKMGTNQMDTSKKTKYQIEKHNRLEAMPLLCQDEIQNMIYVSLKNVNELFDLADIKGVGIPTCISSTGSRFLVIGTSLGNIGLFQIGIKGYRTLSIENKNNPGQVTSVAVSRDNRYLTAGYETGIIAIWDLYNFKLVKSELIRKTPITKVLFCSETYENFIANDSLGFIYMFTIQSSFWISTRYQLLIERIQNRVYYDIKYSRLKSNRNIIALCSLNEVTLISLKPNIQVLQVISRPSSVFINKIPNCELGVIGGNDTLCISWSKSLFIYGIETSQSRTQRANLLFTLQHPTVIHNIEFLCPNIIVTVDDCQVYRVINLQESIRASKLIIINIRQLESETIYQRFMKDKKGKSIKLYSNTMMNCSFDPKYKEIFFIAKNGIFRGRLEKWTTIIHDMLKQQKQWQQALKLCLQLYRGNLNIFVDPFHQNKNTMALLCDMGRIYLKQKMTEVRNKNPTQINIKAVADEAEEVFQITIEFFLKIQCQRYLFQKVFHSLIKETYYYQYYELLIRCIQPFIEHQMIKKIPYYPVFQQIITEYSDRPQLINKLVISLEEESLHYEDLVDICTKQRLYEALCYICAIRGDFISPANKILATINPSMNQKNFRQPPKQQANKNYLILKQYIEKTVRLFYPNNKPISTNNKISKALQEIQIWISSELALEFFLRQHEQDLFQILSMLVDSLLRHNLQHFVIDLCQQLAQNFEKSLKLSLSNKSETKQKKVVSNLLTFLINCSLFQSIHFYISLISTILKIQYQIIKQQLETVNKPKNFINGIKFIDKYIVPILQQKIKRKIEVEQRIELLTFFEENLLAKININLQGFYHFVKSIEANFQEEPFVRPKELTLEEDSIASQISKNIAGGQRKQMIEYLLMKKRYSDKLVNQYLDLAINWAPQATIVHIFEKKGIQKVNKHLQEIKDQRQQYLIVRKILKFLRKKDGLLEANAPTKKSSNSASIIFGLREESGVSQNQKSEEIILVEPNLNKNILLAYIESVCKYKKEKRVFYELKTFPNDYSHLAVELLPIVQKFKLKSCESLLLEYQLRYEDAFHLYAQVYEQYFDMNFKKLISYEHCHGRFMAYVFHLMLDLCYRIRKQSNWTNLLEYILSPLERQDNSRMYRSRSKPVRKIDTIQKIYEIKSTKNHPFMHELQDVIEATIISASREIPMTVMAHQLNKYSDLLGKTFIINCLTSTMKNSYKRVESFEISKELMVIEYVVNFKNFFTNHKLKGKSSHVFCLQCQEKPYDINDKLIVLECGHGYHQQCINSSSCLSQYVNTASTTKCRICSNKQFGDPERINMYEEQKKKGAQIVTSVQKENTEAQQEMINNRSVYKCLGFQEYIVKRDSSFQQFCSQYEKYIQGYKSY